MTEYQVIMNLSDGSFGEVRMTEKELLSCLDRIEDKIIFLEEIKG